MLPDSKKTANTPRMPSPDASADSEFHTTQPFDMSTMPMGLDTFASENIDLEAYAREDEEKTRVAPKAGEAGKKPAGQ